MHESTVRVEVDGKPVAAASLEIQAEEAIDAADALTLVAPLDARDDGEWTSALDALVTPRAPVVVEISRGGSIYRFDGRSMEVSWAVAAGGRSSITVKALDRTLDMDMEEKVASWPNTSDSGIASALFSRYSLAANVRDTPRGPAPEVHTVLQRGTDWAFLRALAVKWGYAAYLESERGRVTGHFHPLDPLAEPQTELALGFGTDSGAASVQVNLTAGQAVTATRIPALSDVAQTAKELGNGKAQGSFFLGGQVSLLLAPTDVDGELEPAATAAALARQSSYVVTLNTEIDASRTGLLLRARRTVLVKGLGKKLSGRYLVRRVRHRLTPGTSHVQELTLVRNALGLKSDEPFGRTGRV